MLKTMTIIYSLKCITLLRKYNTNEYQYKIIQYMSVVWVN